MIYHSGGRHLISQAGLLLAAVCLTFVLLGCQPGKAPLSWFTDTFNNIVESADNDNDGISDSIEDQMAERFAPVVRIHPNEKYLPASIRWYLPRVRLRFDVNLRPDEQVLGCGEVNPVNLLDRSNRGQFSGLCTGTTDFFLEQTDGQGGDKLDDYREQTRRGTEPSGWVCYVHVMPAAGHQGMYDIQYIFFYPYNGDMAWGPIESGHEADWEHITVRVAEDLQTIHRIYYAAHEGEGRWYAGATPPGEKNGYSLTSDGHPIVYCALDSHASYPRAGEWDRKQNFNDFMQDGGPEWDCRTNITNIGEKLYPRGDMQWVQYSGRWGEIGEASFTTGPYGPAYQNWWEADPQEGDVEKIIPREVTGEKVVFPHPGILHCLFGVLFRPSPA